MIETRDGSDDMVKQHVWGLGYVDELAQIRIPLAAGLSTRVLDFYAMQDANYNVVGLV